MLGALIGAWKLLIRRGSDIPILDPNSGRVCPLAHEMSQGMEAKCVSEKLRLQPKDERACSEIRHYFN